MSFVDLPLPKLRGHVSVEEALCRRRSIRRYRSEPLTIEQLSQLLWAAYGLTLPKYEFKTCPSAGATYPLEVYAVIGEKGVKTDSGFLEAGVYRYHFARHSLELVKHGDVRVELAKAALDQPWVREAPVNFVICAVFRRTTARYGQRGYRYVYIEVGHAGQNIYLEATALGLGTVAIGAFYDEMVKKVIAAREDEEPVYIMPVGVADVPPCLEEEIYRAISSARG